MALSENSFGEGHADMRQNVSFCRVGWQAVSIGMTGFAGVS